MEIHSLKKEKKRRKKSKQRGIYSTNVSLWHQHSTSFHLSRALCKPSKETFDKSLWNSKEYFRVLSPALKPDDLHRKLTFKMSFIINSQVPNPLKCEIPAANQVPNKSFEWVWLYWGFIPQKRLHLKVKQHFANPHGIQT